MVLILPEGVRRCSNTSEDSWIVGRLRDESGCCRRGKENRDRNMLGQRFAKNFMEKMPLSKVLSCFVNGVTQIACLLALHASPNFQVTIGNIGYTCSERKWRLRSIFK